SRAVHFSFSFCFVFTTLGVNISANSLSAANDLTALFPFYMNIRRGQLLAWAFVP
ncbi:hypothetical protein BU23DRAFT_475791, partial [Bimuria novae-zelandiae CBS 107.79]